MSKKLTEEQKTNAYYCSCAGDKFFKLLVKFLAFEHEETNSLKSELNKHIFNVYPFKDEAFFNDAWFKLSDSTWHAVNIENWYSQYIKPWVKNDHSPVINRTALSNEQIWETCSLVYQHLKNDFEKNCFVSIEHILDRLRITW